MTQFYDNVVLYTIFVGYFGRIWLWVPAVLAVILLLPLHRRSANVLFLCLLGWHLMCMLLWDMYRHVPLAAWTISAMVLLRGALLLWYLVPHGWFSEAILRQYLRFDPACGYLLDLARARRGLPVQRTPADRRLLLPRDGFSQSVWNKAMGAFARFCDRAIPLLPHLPAYWLIVQRSVNLDQPHVWAAMEDESAKAEKAFREAYLDVSLEEFRQFTSQEKMDRDLAARRNQRRLVHLTEAMAEYCFFLPSNAKGSKHASVAFRLRAKAWRLRRRHDRLWWPQDQAASPVPSPRKEAAPAPAPDAAPATESPLLSDDEPAVTVKNVDLDGTAAEGGLGLEETQVPAAPEPAAQEADSSRIELSAVEPPAQEEPAPAEQAVAVEADSSSASNMDDEELYRLAAQEADRKNAAQTRDDGSHMFHELLDDPRIAARNRDIVVACQCLEAFLGLAPCQTVEDSILQAKPFMNRPETWAAAVQLLVMYCARMDWQGEAQERQRLSLVESLWSDVASRLAACRPGQPAAQRKAVLGARIVLADLLLSREEFSLVRSLYPAWDDLTGYEMEILGEACSCLGQQVASLEELQNMLRFEAMDCYFRGGLMGVWRGETSERIIGRAKSSQHLVEVMDEHPLEMVAGWKLQAPDARAIVCLQICQGRQAGRLVPVKKLPLLIGRAPEADLCIADTTVSRRHCCLEAANEKLVVKDLGSSCGTFVNGNKVETSRLVVGDRVRVGRFEFQVLAPAQASAVAGPQLAANQG